MIIEREIIATKENKNDRYLIGTIRSLEKSPKTAGEELARFYCYSHGYYFIELRDK